MAGGGFLNKVKNIWTPPEDENEYEERETIDTEPQQQAAQDDYDYSNIDYTPAGDNYDNASYDNNVYSSSNTTEKGNVMDFNSAVGSVEVILYSPTNYKEETHDIADNLVKGKTVILNLETAATEEARRILDFLSGAAFAKQGKIRQVSNKTYIIAPMGVKYTSNDESYPDDDDAEE